MYLLDTDHITILEVERGAEFGRLRSRLAEVDEGDVAAAIVSFEEQTRGWLSYLAQVRSLPEQVEAYARLRRMVENYRWILPSRAPVHCSNAFNSLRVIWHSSPTVQCSFFVSEAYHA